MRQQRSQLAASTSSSSSSGRGGRQRIALEGEVKGWASRRRPAPAPLSGGSRLDEQMGGQPWRQCGWAASQQWRSGSRACEAWLHGQSEVGAADRRIASLTPALSARRRVCRPARAAANSSATTRNMNSNSRGWLPVVATCLGAREIALVESRWQQRLQQLASELETMQRAPAARTPDRSSPSQPSGAGEAGEQPAAAGRCWGAGLPASSLGIAEYLTCAACWPGSPDELRGATP